MPPRTGDPKPHSPKSLSVSLSDSHVSVSAKMQESLNSWEYRACAYLRLGHKKYFTRSNYIDIRGYVKDHLPNLLDLTSAKFHYDDERRSPNPEDVVYKNIVSKFEDFGDVRVLGSRGNPELIIVDVDGRMDEFPPPMITDDYESLDVGWWLYDAMEPSLFSNVNLEDIQTQGYVVNLAAYVKVSANNEKQD
ncbi:hypothetical protein COCON_G00098110 [Conger conger]|uniref:Uncharacterized protein n=1 Tax=Conger conger TaxID=82655 RepID=A0A9Q1DMF0_CONCO|nr:hypothetical protein COCON_G00098110 [Conger conger]